MEENEKVNGGGPVSTVSIVLILLMLAVTVFLFLIQNIDRFSSYFGGTLYKVIFDVALTLLFFLLIIYIFHRSSSYSRKLEGIVERLRQSNTMLQVLNAIQSNANATLESHALLDESLASVMPIVSGIGIVYLFDEGESYLLPRACFGIDAALESLPRYSLGEGLVGRSAELGQPLEEGSEAAGAARAEGGGAKSPMYRIALPIKTGSKVIGSMMAGRQGQAFTPEEKILLHATAEVLGNSLTNAKLFDITQRALDTTRRTQNYLESLLREGQIGALVLDEKGAILYINVLAEAYLEAQGSDIRGKNYKEALAGLGWRGQRLIQAIEGCLDQRVGAQFNHPLNDDPESLLMLIRVFPLFEEKGDFIGAAATLIRS
jgi:hypothetical protein